jgi:mannose-1-phosphate guanylyltransferase / mannose-6-phosphate isomerase
VILCGGSGIHLWPPVRDKTLLQGAAARSLEISPGAEPLIVCGEGLRYMVADQLRRIGVAPRVVLVEPEGRGTAPALTLAAVHSVTDDDPVLLAMPSDHMVSQPEAFRRALEHGAALAGEGYIVTFGVQASSPHTGYGYLRAGAPVARGAGSGAQHVEAFVEKPDRSRALEYVRSGEYRWNAGIFAVRASVWIDAIGCYKREILAACQRAYRRGRREGAYLRMDESSFAGCPADSIDYAVMERIAQDAANFQAVVVNLEAGWSDVCAGAEPAGADARTSAAGSP